MDKERYNDYKLLAMNYGKLEECIYEDGTFSISLTCSSYIKGQQLAACDSSIWITVEKLCEMIERSTEQTFGLPCTFFICNDILKTQPY